ncbi:hypothetical protein Q5P01_001010 [Channa striata]|uniref:Uncharacterized protein n=1 Tax=Channa striata TaxID=64152 RepID=A0AA88IIN3_CHASR|nr:hypothetical protein Q5P01_001010 [Channa striata]
MDRDLRAVPLELLKTYACPLSDRALGVTLRRSGKEILTPVCGGDEENGSHTYIKSTLPGLTREREREPHTTLREARMEKYKTAADSSSRAQAFNSMIQVMKGASAGCWSIVESNPGTRENFDIWVRGRGCTVQYVVRQVDDSATSRSFLYTLSRFNDIPIVAHTRDDILELCKNDALLDDGEDARRDYEMIRRAERDPLRQGDRGLRSADGAEHKRPHIYVDPANGSTAPFHLAEGDLKGLRRGMMDMTLSSGATAARGQRSLDPTPRCLLDPNLPRDLKPRRTTDFDGARPDDRRETGCRRPGVDYEDCYDPALSPQRR